MHNEVLQMSRTQLQMWLGRFNMVTACQPITANNESVSLSPVIGLLFMLPLVENTRCR